MANNIHITEDELNLIDQYLAGQLTNQEKLAFEEQLSGNEAWKIKFNEVKLLSVGIQESSLREQLNDFHNHTMASKIIAPVKKMSWVKRLTAAASILFFISLLSWLFFFKPSAEEKIFASFFQPDPGLSTAMGVSDNYDFDRAMVDYKTKNYNAAIQSWSKLLETNAGNDTLHYFIGAAQIANKNETAAITHFDKVLQNTGSVFISEALWYKALALIKQGKKQEAIPLIEKTSHSQKQALLLKLKD